MQQATTSSTIIPSASSHNFQQLGQGQPVQGQVQSPGIRYDILQSNTGSQLVGQSHQQLGQGPSNQGHIQQLVLQPQSQYGMKQTSCDKPPQYTFHIDLNQPNYVMTADQQLVPVIPVFKCQGNPQSHLVQNQGIFPLMQQPTPSMPQSSVIITGQHTSNANQISHLQNEVLPQTTLNVPTGSKVSLSADTCNTVSRSSTGAKSLQEYQIVTNEGIVVVQATAHDNNNAVINTGSFVNVNPNATGHNLVTETKETSRNVDETTVSVAPGEKICANEQQNIGNPEIGIENNNEHSVNVPSSVLQDDSMRNSEALVNRLRNVENVHFMENNQNRNYTDEVVYKIAKSTFNPTVENYGNGVETLPSSHVSSGSTVVSNNEVGHSESAHILPTDQTVAPVSYVPVLDSNSEPNEDLPSQIQISFKTCSSSGDQIGFSQQIVMPHSNVVTLPLIPMCSTESAGGLSSATYQIANDQIIKAQDGEHSRNIDAMASDNLKGKVSTIIEDDNELEKPDSQLSRLKVVRSRNVSGRKSRNSSGSSEKSRNSSASSEKSRNFSGSSEKSRKLSDHGQECYLDIRNEHFNDGHFMSKLDKIRHRQMSGNSDHNDRSRKSSGNSISDTSSHVSGLTLSNLASPNIFHDKDKGIFFMQSLEFSEIDSGHVADFIQAVESDNTVNILNHQMDEDGAL